MAFIEEDLALLYPALTPAAIDRLAQLQDVIADLDDETFDAFVRLGRRLRQSQPG